METKIIQIEILIQAQIQKTWNCWNEPSHIQQWFFASSDWYVPTSKNELTVGGKLTTTMAAKDGSIQFDFAGTYTLIEAPFRLAYTLDDGRKVSVSFIAEGDSVKVIERFEPEAKNPLEMQEAGWNAILQNFKKHVEAG